MKAVRLHERGGPEQIVVEEVLLPEPGPHAVRIKVQAAAITPGELGWDETYRNPDKTPRFPSIPGHDVAGVIDKLGTRVTDLKAGDLVYALINFPLNGSAAEYVIVPGADVALRPQTITAEEAAAVPLSALTAWQALFDHGKLKAGQRVLIHGGAGGVGGYAVQMARSVDAHVIATTSTPNLASVQEAGANDVIDYTKTSFEQALRDVDLVFDTVGGETLAKSFTVLKRGGILVSIAGIPNPQQAADAGTTGLFFIVHPSRSQLGDIARLIDAGKLRVRIQETFPLERAREAFERSVAGHLSGKVVLTMPAG